MPSHQSSAGIEDEEEEYLLSSTRFSFTQYFKWHKSGLGWGPIYVFCVEWEVCWEFMIGQPGYRAWGPCFHLGAHSLSRQCEAQYKNVNKIFV